MGWLRRSFIAGFFLTVPLVVSVAALVWIFGIIDGFTAPLTARVLGYPVPGLGILLTVGVVLAIGGIATNVIGRRMVATAESWLMMIPVFRTIYAPVKQLAVAFSPDNEYGFKRVVMVDDPHRGWVMGFLTKEFTLASEQGSQAVMAIYVPTNHLYLGDIAVYPRERAFFPDLSVEEGIRIFLTGGMSLPGQLRRRQDASAPALRGVSTREEQGDR